jgi:hypothetical protein
VITLPRTTPRTTTGTMYNASNHGGDQFGEAGDGGRKGLPGGVTLVTLPLASYPNTTLLPSVKVRIPTSYEHPHPAMWWA